MTDVTTVAAMRASDAAKIASGMSGRELMERAGAAIYAACDFTEPVAIVCGTGNNAGDGYVLAGLLKKDGMDVTLILAKEDFSEDGRFFYERARSLGVPSLLWTPYVDLTSYTTIVDCLFGTGFRGNVSGNFGEIIRSVNLAGRQGSKVIAADIPSGLSGDNGQGDPIVRADVTCSVGMPKTGHFLGKAKDYVGKLHNLDIGINIIGETYSLVDASDFSGVIPRRKCDCNKGDFGTVILLGGCAGYSGAAKLANLSLSALRAGCGVAKLAVPDLLQNAVLPYLLESTLVTLPDQDGFMKFDVTAVDLAFAKVKAAAVGMGWGQGGGNRDILAYILENYNIPLIIDADGLNLLAKIGLHRLQTTRCKPILTPHLLEFERLSGIPRENVLRSPIEYARNFARENRVTLLLKGPTTVITDGLSVYLCDRGCPGMATAGSGDVLSGVLAGVLGYYSDNLPLAAACGAWINGRAGEIAQEVTGPVSMIASDTVAAIPKAVSEIYKYHEN